MIKFPTKGYDRDLRYNVTVTPASAVYMMPADDIIVIKPGSSISNPSELIVSGIPNPQTVYSTTPINFNVYIIKANKFIDHFQYAYTHSMVPSSYYTQDVSITSSSLESGHTNVTITFSFKLINLMKAGSKIELKFSSTLFPIW